MERLQLVQQVLDLGALSALRSLLQGDRAQEARLGGVLEPDCALRLGEPGERGRNRGILRASDLLADGERAAPQWHGLAVTPLHRDDPGERLEDRGDAQVIAAEGVMLDGERPLELVLRSRSAASWTSAAAAAG